MSILSQPERKRTILSTGLPVALAYVRQIQIQVSVIRDMRFARRQIVAQQHIEHPGSLLRRVRLDFDEPSRGGIHRGEVHHVRVVFAKALGALDIRL